MPAFSSKPQKRTINTSLNPTGFVNTLTKRNHGNAVFLDNGNSIVFSKMNLNIIIIIYHCIYKCSIVLMFDYHHCTILLLLLLVVVVVVL